MKLPKRWNIKPLNLIPDDYSRWWKAGQHSKGTNHTRKTRILLVYNTNSILQPYQQPHTYPDKNTHWQAKTKDTWHGNFGIKLGRNMQPTFFKMGSPNWKAGADPERDRTSSQKCLQCRGRHPVRLTMTLGPSELCTIKRFLYYSGGVGKERFNGTANSS